MRSTSKKIPRKNPSSNDNGPGQASYVPDNRSDVLKFTEVQETLQDSARVVAQRKAFDDALGTSAAANKIENNTGLPDNLKAGVENLSGYSMDDVKVHYNSGKPAQINAHAYTQKTEIYVAPGQEKHLSHEAWHIVQQKEGRVKPTTTIGNIPVNNDVALEKEADIMGTRAHQNTDHLLSYSPSAKDAVMPGPGTVQRMPGDAGKFITDNNLKGVKAKLVSIRKYVKDKDNPQDMRYGLRDAWNKGLEKTHTNYINYSDQVVEQGRQSHQEKVTRETKNKLDGDIILATAMDEYESQKMSGPISIAGFRLCRYKGGIAVAVSRSTGREESKSMKQSKKIERVEHADSYKWFSESQAHAEKFVNYSSSDTGSSLVIWLDLSGYLALRKAMSHEYGSSGLKQNRFHQENVSIHSHLVNIGIHSAFDSKFQSLIINVKDLESVGKLKEQSLTFFELMPEELLFVRAAGFESVSKWRKSDAFKWYEDMVLTFGEPIAPTRRDALLRRIQEEFLQ
jgi:hypothetical protein